MKRSYRGMLSTAFLAVLMAACATVPEASPAPASIPWRVVTYNIHHGRGMDDRVDLERIASVLRHEAPDIVALQEVDERVERSGGVDQAERLGELLGMHHAFGSFMDYQGGRYGLAVLSRCTIRSVDVVRLTEGREPRVALVVEILLPDASVLTAVNVHFDWTADDRYRFAQALEVAHVLDELPGPWILAGDLNDEPGSRTVNLFHARGREAAKPPGQRFTFSSTDPRKEIDFVFVSPADAWGIGQVEVVNESLASDHLPVVAELELHMIRSQRSTDHGTDLGPDSAQSDFRDTRQDGVTRAACHPTGESAREDERNARPAAARAGNPLR